MTSTLDDEELALSVHPSHTRRGSSRGTSQDGGTEIGNATATAAEARSAEHQSSQQSLQSSSLTGKAFQRLGQYHVLKTLGEGSFGKVKLAVHQTTGQKVALKIISRRKLMARDMAGRVEREIQYLQLLRHPHIIKLYTVITTPSEIIMVLEYAGSELFNYIVDHGKMAEDKARQFFQQIVCAVEYCHRHKIVHRDLKPENLLLDDNLHVKIADFGLSNIMTDGNFLKTSCGSPNYAAPEVISGKLYAGPEVDVWSCGVILYVLLCGRLPFDDEYIPALFKKIASGSYTIPNYLSSGANKLIKKMLQVSPVMRYTVQEIRQDPWFVKDLPLYLQPQVEDFMDTGIDPNKAIDPRDLAPSKPAAMQEKLHESVVGKLGKTMGYGREDVQQALKDEEPNAIKDAYLIVRENQIMRTTPSLAKDPSLQPFLAQSPPAFQTHSPIAATMMEGLDAPGRVTPSSPLRDMDRPRLNSTTSGHIAEARSPVSSIGVLPSSLPDFHQASMRGQPKPLVAAESQNESPGRQTSEQQAATARRLKPHSRSSLNIDKVNRPEGLTPLQAAGKKPRPTKWQFGIRSRNQPAEAMLAIYKALRAMGAEWEVTKARKAGGGSSGDASPRDGSPDATQSDDGDSSDSDGHARGQHSYESDSDQDDDGRSTSSSPARGGRDRDGHSKANRYNSKNDWGYLVPQDPWIINARFRKGDMYAPGVAHPTSAHSSRVDLVDPPAQRRRANSGASTASATPSAGGSDAGVPTGTENATTASSGRPESAHSLYSAGPRTGSRRELGGGGDDSAALGSGAHFDDSAYVYLTIQLYSIEKEFYLVDFKCAGYERLVRNLVVHGGGLVSQQSEDIAEEAAGGEDDDYEESARGDDARGRPTAAHQMAVKDFAPKRSPSATETATSTPMPMRHTHEELVGQGRATEEKDVSSPFPFLDVASRLIIQLAEAE